MNFIVCLPHVMLSCFLGEDGLNIRVAKAIYFLVYYIKILALFSLMLYFLRYFTLTITFLFE